MIERRDVHHVSNSPKSE